MKHQHHFGSATDVALRDVARISALISDIDRHVRILDRDIAAEEKRASMSNRRDAAYPILARTLAARRDNLKDTISALEKRLAGLQDRTGQVPLSIERPSNRWPARVANGDNFG
jgi:septation ring formation regulator EzrA